MTTKWTSLLAAAFVLGTVSAASAVVDINGDDSFNAAFAQPDVVRTPTSAEGAFARAPGWQSAPDRPVVQPRGRVNPNARPQQQR